MGELDRAYEQLGAAAAQGRFLRLNGDPLFVPLSGDPRFAGLGRRFHDTAPCPSSEASARLSRDARGSCAVV